MKQFQLPIRFEAILYVKSEVKIKYLIIRRVPEDGGFWQPITGTHESNESLESCMVREIKEEAGYDLDLIERITDKIYEFTWLKKGVIIYEYVFGVELKKQKDPILSPFEHDKFSWLPYEEAVQKLKMEENKRALTILNQILLE
jgi:lipoyl(octanoyl) transferase